LIGWLLALPREHHAEVAILVLLKKYNWLTKHKNSGLLHWPVWSCARSFGRHPLIPERVKTSGLLHWPAWSLRQISVDIPNFLTFFGETMLRNPVNVSKRPNVPAPWYSTSSHFLYRTSDGQSTVGLPQIQHRYRLVVFCHSSEKHYDCEHGFIVESAPLALSNPQPLILHQRILPPLRALLTPQARL